MVKRILALSLLMVGLMGLSGCGDGGDAGPAAQELNVFDMIREDVKSQPGWGSDTGRHLQ